MGFKGIFEGWHLVILIIVILLIFGANRLPDAARSLGRSMRIFKSEVNQMQEDKPSAASRSTVDGDVVTEQTRTTTHTDAAGRTSSTTTHETTATAPGGATAEDDYVVIDGVRYRREPGDRKSVV